MATLHLDTGTSVQRALDTDKVYVITNEVSLVGVVTGDVVECLLPAAGTVVYHVMTEVLENAQTAAGATTFTMGDTDSTAGWDGAITITAGTTLAKYAGVITTDALVVAGGKLYTDGTKSIDAVVTTAGGVPLTTGKIRVAALCMTPFAD